MAQTARIVGQVEYREGDGPNIPIRPGSVKVQMGLNDVTLSWVDEETRGSAAMPLTDFKRHLAEGRIVMDEPLAPPTSG
jgi:predicted component of type VI protein secretion system